MLLDCTHIPAEPTNEAMEYLCKAQEESGLFHPHPTDRLLSAMEDASTEWVSRALSGIYTLALQAFGTAGHASLTQILAKAIHDEPLTRCRELRRKIVSKGPGSLTLGEYLDVIECWIDQYLPEAISLKAAKRSALRQYLVGLSRYMTSPRTVKAAKGIVEALPESVHASESFNLTRMDIARVRVAQASAARHITDLTNATRSAIQGMVIQAERAKVEGQTSAYRAEPLEQQLQSKFRLLGRDWRRVAVTETAINSSDAYLSRMELGASVKWVAHPGMCRYCESQNGKIFTVVASDAPRKDPNTQIWMGKHVENIGRSISKRKRLESGELVERTEDELIIPAIPAHPICRCLWVIVA